MKILIASLVSILILKTDTALAFESRDQLTQPTQKQDFMLPGVCEFNPDLPMCKKYPICKIERFICEKELTEKLCLQKPKKDFLGVCDLNQSI